MSIRILGSPQWRDDELGQNLSGSDGRGTRKRVGDDRSQESRETQGKE